MILRYLKVEDVDGTVNDEWGYLRDGSCYVVCPDCTSTKHITDELTFSDNKSEIDFNCSNCGNVKNVCLVNKPDTEKNRGKYFVLMGNYSIFGRLKNT